MYYPNLASWDPTKLVSARNISLENKDEKSAAVKGICHQADLLLQKEMLTVISKSESAAALTGDAHYYASLSSYFWEDISDKSAPWIYRDGEYNNEVISQYDFLRWEQMVKRVMMFTLSWWCTGNKIYEEAAIDQIRIWFINKDTFMYPSLEYAQTIPNKSKGSHAGIIDINQIDRLINCFGLIEKSKLWTLDDSISLKKWCADLLIWLHTSEQGKKERASDNNHGIYYDKIVLHLASYAENKILLTEIINDFTEKRIGVQVDENGDMTHEMRRADAYHYLNWTLAGIISVACLAENYGYNIWNLSPSKGGSIREVVNTTNQYINGKKIWTYKANFDKNFTRFIESYWILGEVYKGEVDDIFNSFIAPSNTVAINSHYFNIVHPKLGGVLGRVKDSMKSTSYY